MGVIYHYLIEAEWCIYAPANQAISGSDNDFTPYRSQAIILINAGILLNGFPMLNEIEAKYSNFHSLSALFLGFYVLSCKPMRENDMTFFSKRVRK